MDPTGGDWWWRYGLDGIVGGIVGGAVTGLAVWLTLRHGRTLASQSRLDAERTALKIAVAALHAEALGLVFTAPSDPRDEAWGPWMATLFRGLSHVSVLAKTFDSDLADDLDRISDTFAGDPTPDQGFDRAKMVAVAKAAMFRCRGWLTRSDRASEHAFRILEKAFQDESGGDASAVD